MTSAYAREADRRVAETLAELRAKLAAASAEKSAPVVPEGQDTVTVAASERPERQLLPTPEVLAPLFPGGGLARGTVVAVDGARSVLVSMIAEVTAAGGYVAVIGLPHLSLHAAAEMGADLSHIATVGAPGPDPVEVAAVLLDGLDLVVVGLAGASVPPSRTRAVMARARAKGAAMLVTDGVFSGAHATLTAQVADYRHLPYRHLGHGRIAGLSLTVAATGRGMRRIETGLDVVSQRGRVRLVAATPGTAVGESTTPQPQVGSRSLSVAN
ncbi:hypothetical protein [Williamsia sp. CHRR-6]|uniref:hypothetical protein n=1 Tax=Williamsia sp. CHRR-6 TaxID=2835871 RepID=UPI001BD97D4E|nr:hypothetical protein [Williamsia sp. CHRR-6]MBT0566777.1 hypothetical protein [Williamsia sp. CHRR-6]